MSSLKYVKLNWVVVLCLMMAVVLAFPKPSQASDKISEALYGQGIEIVEKAISDYKTKEAEYLKLYDEEMAKIAALQEELNRLQQERAQASEELNSINAELERIKEQERQLKKAAEKLAEEPTSYTVIRGDCLWIIAGYKQVYNNPYKWVTIYSANRDKIKNPDLIYPGQILKILRGTIGTGNRPNQYEVMPGDFLYKIAGLEKIYGDPKKWPTIYQANRNQINNPNLIYPHQVFDIPR